jgi:choline dehydrogenase
VRLASADPEAAADFDGRFLSQQSDVDTLVRGLRLARRILRAPSMAKVIDTELAPSADAELTDEQLEAHVRSHAKTVYHPSGTCRMGADSDPMAVLTPDLRVRGIQGLRVADASAFPLLVSGNTNAPVVMLAERCAAFILNPTGASSPSVSA